MSASSMTFAQLKKTANAPVPAGQFTVKTWLNSVRKLLDEAKSAKQKGELETVYLHDVRAITIILEILPAHEEFKTALEKEPALKTTYQKLKEEVIGAIAEAEDVAKILQARDDERNMSESKDQIENIQMPQSHPISPSPSTPQIPQTTQTNATFDPSRQNLNSPPPNTELSPSPVYIIGGNMIGNVTSTSDPNVPTAVPISSIAERIKNLANSGFNKEFISKNLNIRGNSDNRGITDPSLISPPQSKSHIQMPMPMPTPTPTPAPTTPLSPDLSPPTSSAQRESSLKDFPPSDTIQASQLYKFLSMTENPPKILVFDVRYRTEFDKGHIKTKNIVCLEPFLLKDGVSSIDIEQKLSLSPKHEMNLFAGRHTFDLIVYHDQNSVCLNKSTYNSDNAMQYLFKAIYETEFKKYLPRKPVLLNGGFDAWSRLTGEKGVERNVNDAQVDKNVNGSGTDIPIKVRATETQDRSKRNGVVIPDEHSTWVNTLGDPRVLSTSPQKQEGIFNRINQNEVISIGRAPYIQNYMDFYTQLNGSQMQSMTGPNHSANRTTNNSYDSHYSGVAPKPVGPPPNKPLPQKPSDKSSSYPTDQSNTTKSDTTLKRRRTIFDHPYHGFSVVDNPEYPPLSQPQPPPPPPKKPLPQTPVSNEEIPAINATPAVPYQATGGTQMVMSYHPEQSHHRFPASESSFSQLGCGIGSTGLKNLGNTCFLNSIVQCLSGTVPFSRYFLDGSYKRHINKENPLGTKGVLTEAFATLIRAMWSETYTFVSPVTFKETVGRFSPQFSGSDQHDSQEFLAFLLDRLHEDLNVIKVKPRIKELTPKEEEAMESLEPQIASTIEWEKYLMLNSSVVVSLFQGQFRNRLTCLVCQRTSTTYNTFMYLSLPIPQKYKGERVDLEACLKHFVKEEVLEGDNAWHCPRCNCRRRATAQLTISRLPDVLLIHLKRFSFDGPFRNKLETMVDFPIRNLDLTAYVPPPTSRLPSVNGYRPNSDIPGFDNSIQQTGPFVYDLYAVSNHYGGLSGGHYTACVRNGYRNEWHKFDDSRVSVCDEQDVKTRAAYNLFYVRSSIK